jgi:hypothetical protein
MTSSWSLLMPLRSLSSAVGWSWLVTIALAAGSSRAAVNPHPPPIPIGLDAYRFWDRWPEQRIGMRTYMRSTYERRGANEGADASHFLYQESDDFNVTLDLEGPGLLVFSRYNHWHGSPWHYIIDGKDHIIKESSTADPLHPDPDSTFIPQAPFPPPLNETWATTKGADLIWTPIPFEQSFRMAYTRTRYGTGYYIYNQFVPGTALSHPLKSWNEDMVPGQDVLDIISRAGSDIAPHVGTKQAEGKLDVPASLAVTVTNLKGKATLRALKFSIPRNQAEAFTNTHLRITWDKRGSASVDVPIALFYGAGTLYNRDNREFLVKALPVNIRFSNDRIDFACYFPMPFFRSARIELVGAGQAVKDVTWNVRSMPLTQPMNQLAYFHATYKDFPQPVRGEDLELLDTRKTEGSGDWSGSFVGTSFIFSHDGELRTLEGDPRFFFDDSLTPQAQGTGTEEWGGGGDYWGGLNMTLALVGHPVGAKSRQSAVSEKDKIESAYRFLLADLMPFGRNATIRLEHGGSNEYDEHYETIAYWYGAPSPSLIQTDQFQIGDTASEKAHRYLSPEASKPYTLSSRYEWGVDTLDDKEVYPATTDSGRTTNGTSEFKLRLDPENLGVLLRRKLDYSFADQRAEIFITTEKKSDWKPAGIWYLAGSNTVVYSNPREELGATAHVVETSNRRFRDDEFLVPRALTQGRKAIWVRVKFTPVNRPLFPGYPLGDRSWSEIKYTAYCFVIPKQKR